MTSDLTQKLAKAAKYLNETKRPYYSKLMWDAHRALGEMRTRIEELEDKEMPNDHIMDTVCTTPHG